LYCVRAAYEVTHRSWVGVETIFSLIRLPPIGGFNLINDHRFFKANSAKVQFPSPLDGRCLPGLFSRSARFIQVMVNEYGTNREDKT
jgi:hypothetical protein